MADLNKKVVRITIDTKGNFAFEAKEGFQGESCVEQTRKLELALGGVEVGSGVKQEYFDGDDDPLTINIEH